MERNIIIRHNQEELTASIHYPSREKGAAAAARTVCLWRLFAMVL